MVYMQNSLKFLKKAVVFLRRYKLIINYRFRFFVFLSILSILFLCLFFQAGSGWSDSRADEVVVITLEGPVVPVVASYVERGISFAEQHGAVACIIKLNTPGGLYQSTQEIVGHILNARVPVIVYVSPQGGWAGSAGTFITIAAHYAAMAPGTRIGAAHPVSIGPGQEGEVSVPGEKITEDAAAWVRSLAQLRGRNIQAAELAVRESKSYSDQEAMEKKLIDARARNLDELLDQLDRKEFTLQDGRKVIINTRNVVQRQMAMNLREKILLTVSTPEIAYLLFTLGMIGLIAEIYHPGAIFPGVIGGLSLLLGLYGLGNLDAYWGGVLLLVLALGLFTAEAFVVSHGLLGTGGVVSFVMGSLLLFTGSGPGIQISPWLIALTTAIFAALVGLLVLAVVRGQKRQVITGQEGIIGQVAITRTSLTPEGTVFYAGSFWNAVLEEGQAEVGEKVIITAIDGLKLRVRKKT
jgi:membrane-bound serine protease (ClpP class)